MPLIVIIFLLIVPCPSLAESFPLEKIIVKNESSKTDGILSHQEISAKFTPHFSDLLDSVAGLDLRTRSNLGIQSDISLRGSTFEQVAVFLDGVKISDPQTGHFNLDIPLSPQDIERIEVTKEPASGIFGSGALAGSINIITRKPDKKSLHFQSLYGEHALFSEDLSLSLPHEEYSGRLSLGHKTSSGATSNTDFKSGMASLYLARETEAAGFNTLLAFEKKDFGAGSFYSNLFPEEEEHTETLLAKSALSLKSEESSATGTLYLRRHRDKFILNRNNPVSVNYHTTYVYGLDSDFDLPLRNRDLSWGLSLCEEEINSTNLGKHSRMQEGFRGALLFQPAEKLILKANSRIDHFQEWGFEPSWNIGLGYLLDEGLKAEASVAHAFRLPTFTELYYSDAANKGDPGLAVEESESLRSGLTLRQEILESRLDYFYRQGRNLIDWTRSSSLGRWQATNLGKVDIQGIEFICELRPALDFRRIILDKVSFSYSYNALSKKETGLISKYALDILKHKLYLDICSSWYGNKVEWELSYHQRYYGEVYFIGNLLISRKITGDDFTFEPFLRIDNFSNTEYSEVGGVPQPGRWVKVGLRLEW